MNKRLATVIILLASSLVVPACGDDCESGYVDTFGMCVADGYAWQRADAVVSALVSLSVDIPANSTGNCPNGGTVTISGTSACYPVCIGTYSYVFDRCVVEYNDFRETTVRFESGTLTDTEMTGVVDGSMRFNHDISADVLFGGQVLVKETPREFPSAQCVMDFVHDDTLFGTPSISGTMCGDAIEFPLYEIKGE
ncbi:MAG: hypothetical protein AAB426_10010 [Myxococcota bacterium]